MRIARALAMAGIDSRRKCEEYIKKKDVSVNGQIVEDLAFQVDIENDQITFRGRLLLYQPSVYYIVNKPKGYVTTASDRHAKKTVFELLPKNLVSKSHRKSSQVQRVFAVGRLDKDSEGLLLFTNDGEMAHKLMHPRYEIGKWYEVRLHKAFDMRDKAKLLKGLRLREGVAKMKQIKLISKRVLHVLISEGKNREVRRLFEKMDYTVVYLVRIAFGPIVLTDLRLGQGRFLNKKEIKALESAVAD